MDGRRAEEPAGQDDKLELQPSRDVQALDTQTEGVLPEREMAGLDGDQAIQDGPELTRRQRAQAPIERQVEQLVEHEPPRQPPVDRFAFSHGLRSLPCSFLFCSGHSSRGALHTRVTLSRVSPVIAPGRSRYRSVFT